jgi:chromosome segregation ATPase
MATLYNKTALNKIKKADLIQMFLDQQAKLNDVSLDGWMATLEEYKMLKVENKKLKKENDEWETEYCRMESNFESLEYDNKKLKEQLQDAPEEGSWVTCDYQESREKNLNDKINKLKEDLEWNKHEVVRYSVALEEEYVLKDEYEKLKKQNEQLKKEIGYNDTKIERQNWQLDHAYKQLNELMSKATLLKDEIESKEESDSESEEDECVCCGTNFDQHEARYNKGEDLRLKYQKYFGSENDDGDICPECLDKIY